jgi:hypothetical protein
MNALLIPPLSAESLPALPAADIDRATYYARQDKAPATRAAWFSIRGTLCPVGICSRRRPNQRLRELRQWRPRRLSHGPASVKSADRTSEADRK